MVLVHLRTIALRRPQTRVRSLSSVTGNSLKQGICASRPVGPLSASDPSRAQNPQMHQNPREVPWAVIRALKGRVDRFPPRNEGGSVDAGILLDSNPPEDDSWC